MKHILVAALGLVFATPLLAVGAEAGRVRRVEGSVSIQRSGESASEEAQANIPFVPGDRLFTDASGRVEIQFGQTFVRVDTRSSLEFPSDSGGPMSFRLNSGGLYLHTQLSGGDAFTVETPGGLVTAREPGVYRLDVDSGETRLSVIQGSATLDAGAGPMTIETGQRIYARRGQAPEAPQAFGRVDDDFARWDDSLEGQVGQATGESHRYVPEEVAPYAGDLDRNGSWSYQQDVGNVWHPYVAEDWSPYADGRWGWTDYGWTWYPSEAWGWAPFHYGRWGFGAGLGWYWIPGSVWGPAWVSWSFGGGFAGWCPLGFRDRAVFGFREGFGEGFERGFGRGFVNGRAIPRGWNFARTTDLSARNLAQRRVTPTVAQVSAMRTVNSPLQQPTRNFADVHQVRTTQPGAIARTRPTIGDSVPALKRDWKLPTVPRPGVPTPVAPPFASKGHSTEARAFGTSPGGHPTDTRSGQSVRPMPGGAVPPHATATPPTGHPTDTRARGTASGVPQGGHPTDFRGARPGQDFPLSAQRGAGSNPSHPTDRRSGVSSQPSGRSFRDTNPYTNSPRVPQSRYSDRSGPGNGSPWSSPRANPYTNTPRAPEPRYSDRSRSGDGGRSVLRPFFQPLNQPHPQPHIQSAPSAPRTQAPSHPAPSHPAPSHSTPSQPQSGGHRDHGHP